MRPVLVLSTVLFAAATLGAAPADDAVTLKIVKYAELGRIVRNFHGKIVVVDFWGEY